MPAIMSMLNRASLPARMGGAAAVPSTLLNGLVAYWKLDEASGNRIDATGRGNDLAPAGNSGQLPTGKPGRQAIAACFNEAFVEYLSVADKADLSMANVDFSIAVWVYIEHDQKPAIMGILGKSVGGGYNQYEYGLSLDNPSGLFEFDISDGSHGCALQATSFGAPSVATWHLIVAWHDAAADKVYIQVDDGTVDSGDYAYGSFDSNLTFYIGYAFGSERVWDGRIDEAGIWKRVLTSAERTSLYNSGSGNTIPFTGGVPSTFISYLPVGDSKALVAQWPSLLDAYSSSAVNFNTTPTSLAVGGQTIAQLAAGIDVSLATMHTAPHVILWNMGTNDAHPDNGYPEDEVTWKAQVLYCWDALHTKWPTATIKVMKVWRRAYPANCAVLNGWIAYCITQRAFVALAGDESAWLENGDDGATYTIDGTHLNLAGNQRAADIWRVALGY